VTEARRLFEERHALVLRALDRLEEVRAMQPQPDHPLMDAAIQRFAFCIELSCRVFQAALTLEDVEARTPKAALKGAYKAHWLDDEALCGSPCWRTGTGRRAPIVRTSHSRSWGAFPPTTPRAAAEALPGRLTPGLTPPHSVQPPSITMAWPVTKALSSLAR
jgi:hypothetical protein